MILIDRLLRSGIGFVLDKVATAVDAELNDEGHLREQLLDAQMRFELGEIDQAELDRVESSVMARLRELRPAEELGEMRVVGAEATFFGGREEKP